MRTVSRSHKIMKRRSLTAAVMACFLPFPLTGVAHADDDPKSPLQGVWVGQSMESEGKAVPKEAAENMRLTFRGDKLLVKGNFNDDREEECTFKIDPSRSPQQLDIQPPRKRSPYFASMKSKAIN